MERNSKEGEDFFLTQLKFFFFSKDRVNPVDQFVNTGNYGYFKRLALGTFLIVIGSELLVTRAAQTTTYGQI